MDEITQKNIILISTCIIVILFHYSYKLRNNKTWCNILMGFGFFLSLLNTKLLRDWEKQNKTDYNLLLFLYILVDFVIFIFLFLRYFDIRKKLVGGGDNVNRESNIFDRFKKQDVVIRSISDSPFGELVGNKIKERLTDYIVGILSRIRI
tara:strand:+ start:1205 stop:1654 length:450 start_codon:yes stop_codon:yes gene_type:complete